MSIGIYIYIYIGIRIRIPFRQILAPGKNFHHLEPNLTVILRERCEFFLNPELLRDSSMTAPELLRDSSETAP